MRGSGRLIVAVSLGAVVAFGAVACGSSGGPLPEGREGGGTGASSGTPRDPSFSPDVNNDGLRTHFRDDIMVVQDRTGDIPPGTYSTSGVPDTQEKTDGGFGTNIPCEWKKISGAAAKVGDFSGATPHYITGPTKVTVHNGDALLTAHGCDWKKVD